MTAPYDPKGTRRRKDAERESVLSRVAERLEAELQRARQRGESGLIEDPPGGRDWTAEEWAMLKRLENRAKGRAARSSLPPTRTT